jgi:hypothetical protein
LARSGDISPLDDFLSEWERWSAELLESHLSFPVLSYYRSQHDNQSWLGALTAILDTSSLVMTGVEGACERQAELTFAIARHAVVDLSQVFKATPATVIRDRLPASDLARLRAELQQKGLKLRDGVQADHRLAELRAMYEPYVTSLANYLCLTLPPWIRAQKKRDNWQTTAWEGREAGD